MSKIRKDNQGLYVSIQGGKARPKLSKEVESLLAHFDKVERNIYLTELGEDMKAQVIDDGVSRFKEGHTVSGYYSTNFGVVMLGRIPNREAWYLFPRIEVDNG